MTHERTTTRGDYQTPDLSKEIRWLKRERTAYKILYLRLNDDPLDLLRDRGSETPDKKAES
jgi:hypothetical protein